MPSQKTTTGAPVQPPHRVPSWAIPHAWRDTAQAQVHAVALKLPQVASSAEYAEQTAKPTQIKSANTAMILPTKAGATDPLHSTALQKALPVVHPTSAPAAVPATQYLSLPTITASSITQHVLSPTRTIQKTLARHADHRSTKEITLCATKETHATTTDSPAQATFATTLVSVHIPSSADASLTETVLMKMPSRRIPTSTAAWLVEAGSKTMTGLRALLTAFVGTTVLVTRSTYATTPVIAPTNFQNNAKSAEFFTTTPRSTLQMIANGAEAATREPLGPTARSQPHVPQAISSTFSTSVTAKAHANTLPLANASSMVS